MAAAAEQIEEPRSFVLLDELDVGLGAFLLIVYTCFSIALLVSSIRFFFFFSSISTPTVLYVSPGKGGKSIDDANHAPYVSFGLWEGVYFIFLQCCFCARIHHRVFVVSFACTMEADDDITLTRWRCSLIGPQNTNLGQNMYCIEVSCDENYPYRPCTVHFALGPGTGRECP
jgi:hypothetical protein